MKPAWAIQTNLNSLDPTLLADSCRSLGLEVYEFHARTGRDLPDDVPTDRPVLFYGSTFLVQSALTSMRWQPCAYFDERVFRYSRYLAEYGSRMLNQDAEMTTLEALASRNVANDEQLFIRPDNDLKPFAGALWPFGMFLKFYERVREAGDASALTMLCSWHHVNSFIMNGDCSLSMAGSLRGRTIDSWAILKSATTYPMKSWRSETNWLRSGVRRGRSFSTSPRSVLTCAWSR